MQAAESNDPGKEREWVREGPPKMEEERKFFSNFIQFDADFSFLKFFL